MSAPYDLVIVGLSLSSAWGNGHATTFRALIRGLKTHGRNVLFLERNVPWYAGNRDLPEPDFCTLAYYDSVEELTAHYGAALQSAEAVIVGSYVPEGVAVIDALDQLQLRNWHFYDIDTPVTLGKLGRGDEEYIARRQIPLFDSYLSFSGGPTLARLESEFGARLAQALYCSVDAERYGPTGDTHKWDLGYLGTYSPDRQPVLERLLIEPARRLPHMRFVVAGAQFPADIVWPDNVERIEHVAPADHPGFYNQQRFTLNVTRADMVAAGWSPSVRLFEAGACGTPVISDIWMGIDRIFPADAIVLARDSDDVVRALSEVSPAQRNAMAASARRHVLAEHSGSARAGELIAMLEPGRRNLDLSTGKAAS
ncbi:Spore maturation protein CgeB [Devosia crocina]|uniref:Spore maturation protein CgeB n=1 Tax=Devosia crocina TaxID=429728 RepID=A0A1I7NLM8_9HYPH|nr:glycosyltransferase [Devosia crocina]SFV35538.1 Spore maturation protein CgeB [Devosia crocina]